MARIRTVKPEFFKHYDLFKAEQETGLPLRLAFQGLWLCADKEGRFKWQPMQLKLDILPYDNVDFSLCMEELINYGFIEKYNIGNKYYGHIPTFKDHQRITGSEANAESKIPEPINGNTLETPWKQQVIDLDVGNDPKKDINNSESTELRQETPWKHLGNTLDDWKGKERKGKEEGREKERMQESHSFSGSGNLIPEMKKIWQETFPKYTFDEENDSPALKKISDFILKISGKKIGFLESEDEIKALNTFQLIADQVNREPFWVNKPLKSICNNIQEFFNKIKNPINGNTKEGSKNGIGKKLDIDKARAAHARMYGKGNEGGG